MTPLELREVEGTIWEILVGDQPPQMLGKKNCPVCNGDGVIGKTLKNCPVCFPPQDQPMEDTETASRRMAAFLDGNCPAELL
jgi:hypothetical protein